MCSCAQLCQHFQFRWHNVFGQKLSKNSNIYLFSIITMKLHHIYAWKRNEWLRKVQTNRKLKFTDKSCVTVCVWGGNCVAAMHMGKQRVGNWIYGSNNVRLGMHCSRSWLFGPPLLFLPKHAAFAGFITHRRLKSPKQTSSDINLLIIRRSIRPSWERAHFMILRWHSE